MPNGSEVLLDQLEAQGVDCVFASPIAVMAPIWEALARRGDDAKPRYFRCRHELLAVSLAAGYYKATGRSQIVFLPTSLGVQNGSMGLNTALQERTPMTVLSPDTLSYGEDPDADPGPEWPSLLVDLVGPARNAEAVVKWSKRARTASELVHELRRACFIAESVPRGPTLLEVYHNFPRYHPLYGAGPVEAVLGDADAILLAGCSAPWHPPQPALRPGCAVIHAEEDPLRPRAAYWGYPTTHTIPGDLGLNLGALAASLTVQGRAVRAGPNRG